MIPAQRAKQTFAFHLAASLCDGRGDRQAAAMIYDQIVIQRIDVRAIGPDVERYSWASDLDQQYGTLTIVRAFDDQGRDGVGATPSYSTGRFDLSIRDPAPPRPARRRRRAPPARGRLVRPSGFRAPALAGRSVRARHRALGHRSAARRRPAAPAARRRPDAASGLCVDAAPGKRRRVRGVRWRPARARLPGGQVPRLVRGGPRSGDAPQGSRRPWRIGDGDDARRRAAVRPPLRAARRTRAGRDGVPVARGAASRPRPQGYADLRRRVGVPILAGGNDIVDLRSVGNALRWHPWDALRFDVTVAGGFTPSRKLVALAEGAGLWAELQSWGYTLIQAANLHLSLGMAGTGMFELRSRRSRTSSRSRTRTGSRTTATWRRQPPRAWASSSTGNGWRPRRSPPSPVRWTGPA